MFNAEIVPSSAKLITFLVKETPSQLAVRLPVASVKVKPKLPFPLASKVTLSLFNVALVPLTLNSTEGNAYVLHGLISVPSYKLFKVNVATLLAEFVVIFNTYHLVTAIEVVTLGATL